MVKKSKGKPKKPAAAPRRKIPSMPSRKRPAARRKAAKLATPLQDLIKTEPAKPRRKRVAKSLKGSLRPKVSLFLDRATLVKAKAAAAKADKPLTALLEQFVEKGLRKAA